MKGFKGQKILSWILTLTMALTSIIISSTSAYAASYEYPAQLVRISTSDGSRNINISGSSNGSALNTWTTNGNQNENWRLDYISSGVFKIVNQGTGMVITPNGGSTSSGTTCVIAPDASQSYQYWNISAVSTDSLGNGLHYKITNYANSSMALTYNSSANTITLTSYSGSSSQKFLLNSAGLTGFGGYAKDMNGNAKASTIGGLLGETVYVSTFDQLKSACSDSTPRTIVITSDISKTGSYSKDSNGRYRFNDAMIYLYPNKTIVGTYSGNSLYNVYFRTYEGNYGQGNNIIIRNIEISHDTELNNDNIWEFSYGWNFWIDHCTFVGHSAINTASTKTDDWDKFLNFKGTTDYVTISDCKFGLHEYGVLMGYPTDTQETYNTYNGKPCITLANNYYKDCITRAPGLMRYGYFHSLNNYVVNFDMGYTIYTAAKLYSESNYYDGGTGKGSVVNDSTSTSDISYKYPGAYTDSGSTLVNSNFSLTAKTAKACSWRPSSNYSYTAKTASAAKSYCTSYSGAQTSRSKMTYAAFASTGVPSANYITTGSVTQSLPTYTFDLSSNKSTNVNIKDTTGSAYIKPLSNFNYHSMGGYNATTGDVLALTFGGSSTYKNTTVSFNLLHPKYATGTLSIYNANNTSSALATVTATANGTNPISLTFNAVGGNTYIVKATSSMSYVLANKVTVATEGTLIETEDAVNEYTFNLASDKGTNTNISDTTGKAYIKPLSNFIYHGLGGYNATTGDVLALTFDGSKTNETTVNFNLVYPKYATGTLSVYNSNNTSTALDTVTASANGTNPISLTFDAVGGNTYIIKATSSMSYVLANEIVVETNGTLIETEDEVQIYEYTFDLSSDKGSNTNISDTTGSAYIKPLSNFKYHGLGGYNATAGDVLAIAFAGNDAYNDTTVSFNLVYPKYADGTLSIYHSDDLSNPLDTVTAKANGTNPISLTFDAVGGNEYVIKATSSSVNYVLADEITITTTGKLTQAEGTYEEEYVETIVDYDFDLSYDRGSNVEICDNTGNAYLDILSNFKYHSMGGYDATPGDVLSLTFDGSRTHEDTTISFDLLHPTYANATIAVYNSNDTSNALDTFQMTADGTNPVSLTFDAQGGSTYVVKVISDSASYALATNVTVTTGGTLV